MEQKTMKALRIFGINDLRIADTPYPQIIEPTDAIVKVTLATICGSDLHLPSGGLGPIDQPMTVGHECCGEVIAVGEGVKNFKPGDRVIPFPAFFCGQCYMCMNNQRAICMPAGCLGVPSGPDGCFAEYLRVQFADNCMAHIPENLKEEDVIYVYDVAATAYFGLKKGHAKPDDTIVVYGAGPIGMVTGILAKAMFGVSKVIYISRDPNRLELCKEKACADAVIQAGVDDIVQSVMDLTMHMGCDVVVDTVGEPEVIANALQFARIGGMISSVAVNMIDLPVSWALLNAKNLTITAGMQNFEGCDEILNMIAEGQLDLSWLGTHKAPLNDAAEGYEIFEHHKDNCVKWLISPYDHERDDSFEFKVENCRVK